MTGQDGDVKFKVEPGSDDWKSDGSAQWSGPRGTVAEQRSRLQLAEKSVEEQSRELHKLHTISWRCRRSEFVYGAVQCLV